MDYLYTKNSSTEETECVFIYLLNATLNCAFRFLTLVRLRGNLLKILVLA
jgi:hypothetical protein